MSDPEALDRPPRLAVYAGVFDPPTMAHLEIIDSALRIFDELIVVVGFNPNKPGALFSPEDRVRMIEPGSIVKHGASPALLPVLARVPTPVPKTLTLKGISGTSQHRFALINDRTFEAMEKGRVRFADTNIAIRCLEIRDNSVVIQADGSGEKRELFISNK